MVYLVSYDLIRPDRDYKKLTEKIGSYSGRMKLLESLWLIRTAETAVELRDKLSSVMDPNDKLFVVRITGNWAARGLSPDAVQWLKDNVA